MLKRILSLFRRSPAVTANDVSELQKALEVGNAGDPVMSIEPLPEWMFTGVPLVVATKDGSVHDVIASGCDTNGNEDVTVQINGEFVTLEPGEFTVVARKMAK